MLVIPPFLGTAETWFSFVPCVVVEPTLLLADRATLVGAGAFDRYSRARDLGPVCFPDELIALAGVATLGVSARWSADGVARVAARWRADARLPAELFPAGSDLRHAPPPASFLAALDDLVEDVDGVAEGQLSKALACARPGMFPMLDRYLRLALRGSETSDEDWEDRDCFSFWMSRFRRLLLATAPALAEVAPPDDLPYSDTEKLDRLLWLAHFGAAFYANILPHRWITVTGLPATHLLGTAWHLNAYARRHARLVAPSEEIGVNATGEVDFDGLGDAAQRAVVRLLARANAAAGTMWGVA